MGDFCMPSLGADMETGKLVEWLVAPGTRVKRGDIVALVETQKGLFEIEIFQEGFMGDPLVEAGRTVPVGTVLAVIHPEVVTGQIVKTDASLAAAVEPESHHSPGIAIGWCRCHDTTSESGRTAGGFTLGPPTGR